MIDVIKAQLDAAEACVVACAAQLEAARANVVAARILFDGLDVAPAPAPDTGGVCVHPVKLPLPAPPGAWVCQDCSFNHLPQEG